jgi:hypothetical protein
MQIDPSYQIRAGILIILITLRLGQDDEFGNSSFGVCVEQSSTAQRELYISSAGWALYVYRSLRFMACILCRLRLWSLSSFGQACVYYTVGLCSSSCERCNYVLFIYTSHTKCISGEYQRLHILNHETIGALYPTAGWKSRTPCVSYERKAYRGVSRPKSRM